MASETLLIAGGQEEYLGEQGDFVEQVQELLDSQQVRKIFNPLAKALLKKVKYTNNSGVSVSMEAHALIAEHPNVARELVTTNQEMRAVVDAYRVATLEFYEYVRVLTHRIIVGNKREPRPAEYQAPSVESLVDWQHRKFHAGQFLCDTFGMIGNYSVVSTVLENLASLSGVMTKIPYSFQARSVLAILAGVYWQYLAIQGKKHLIGGGMKLSNDRNEPMPRGKMTQGLQEWLNAPNDTERERNRKLNLLFMLILSIGGTAFGTALLIQGAKGRSDSVTVSGGDALKEAMDNAIESMKSAGKQTIDMSALSVACEDNPDLTECVRAVDSKGRKLYTGKKNVVGQPAPVYDRLKSAHEKAVRDIEAIIRKADLEMEDSSARALLAIQTEAWQWAASGAKDDVLKSELTRRLDSFLNGPEGLNTISRRAQQQIAQVVDELNQSRNEALADGQRLYRGVETGQIDPVHIEPKAINLNQIRINGNYQSLVSAASQMMRERPVTAGLLIMLALALSVGNEFAQLGTMLDMRRGTRRRQRLAEAGLMAQRLDSGNVIKDSEREELKTRMDELRSPEPESEIRKASHPALLNGTGWEKVQAMLDYFMNGGARITGNEIERNLPQLNRQLNAVMDNVAGSMHQALGKFDEFFMSEIGMSGWGLEDLKLRVRQVVENRVLQTSSASHGGLRASWFVMKEVPLPPASVHSIRMAYVLDKQLPQVIQTVLKGYLPVSLVDVSWLSQLRLQDGYDSLASRIQELGRNHLGPLPLKPCNTIEQLEFQLTNLEHGLGRTSSGANSQN